MRGIGSRCGCTSPLRLLGYNYLCIVPQGKFTVHDLCWDDLDALWEIDEHAASVLEALFEELIDGSPVVDELFRAGFISLGEPGFSVEWFQEANKLRYPILRLKVCDFDGCLLDYRVLYAYDGSSETYHALLIASRTHVYDTSHASVQRAFAQCEDLGLRF